MEVSIPGRRENADAALLIAFAASYISSHT